MADSPDKKGIPKTARTATEPMDRKFKEECLWSNIRMMWVCALCSQLTELKETIARQKKNLELLGEILHDAHVDALTCVRCGWIGEEMTFHKCHPDSGDWCCEDCGCNSDCDADGSDH